MTHIRQALDVAPMGFYRWSAVGLCVFLNMIDGFDVLVMAFTAASVSAEWSLSGSQLGMLLSAGLFGMAAGSLFIAPWADKVGRKPVTIGCLLLCGITMTAAAAARSHHELAALRVCTGLGIGGILACSNVIASEYSSARWRSLSVSLQSTGYALGATIGGSIAVWLLGHYGWRSVFLFGGIVTLAAVPIVVWRLPESIDYLLARQPRGALGRINLLARRSGVQELKALPVQSTNPAAAGNGVATLFKGDRGRSTLLVWLSFFLVMFGFYFVMSWTPKLLVSAGMGQQQGVTAGVLLSVGGIFSTVIFGLLAARFSITRLAAVVMVTTAVLVSLFVSQVAHEGNAFAMALIIGGLVNACVASLYAIAPRVYDASVRATGVGWGIGVGRIGAIVSPLVAGALIDNGFQPTHLYVGFAMAFAAAGGVVLMHRFTQPDHSIRSAAGAAAAHH